MEAIKAASQQIPIDRDSKHLDEAFAILRGQNTMPPERKHLAAMAEQMVQMERQLAQLSIQINSAAVTMRSLAVAAVRCEQIGAGVQA